MQRWLIIRSSHSIVSNMYTDPCILQIIHCYMNMPSASSQKPLTRPSTNVWLIGQQAPYLDLQSCSYQLPVIQYMLDKHLLFLVCSHHILVLLSSSMFDYFSHHLVLNFYHSAASRNNGSLLTLHNILQLIFHWQDLLSLTPKKNGFVVESIASTFLRST